jgi:hypothetical protein
VANGAGIPARRTVATAWQQTTLLHAVDDHGGTRTANQMAGSTILGALAPLAVYLAARAARGKRKHAQVGRAGLDAR